MVATRKLATILPVTRQGPEALTALGEYSALVSDGAYEISDRRILMNPTQLGGIIRAVMTAAGGIFAAIGWQTGGANWETLTGVAVTIGVAAWSWYTNKTTVMLEAVKNEDPESIVVEVAKSPDVNKVVMKTNALANSTPELAASSNVVGPTAGTR